MSQVAVVKKQSISPKVNNNSPMATQSSQSIGAMVNAMLDGEGYRKRFDELLGKRAPQFVSSIVSMINADKAMRQCFMDSPITIIQSALRAASYDLPIDPGLGYAYIVPFKNRKKLDNGQWESRYEATFIIGYKGMIQLALRTGVYAKINVRDVRKGELIFFDPLREDAEFDWVKDRRARSTMPIEGYAAYFRLINGMEKMIYLDKFDILEHEKKFRKGPEMSKGWREFEDAMCRKTVLRQLIGTWGLMSIDYQRVADEKTIETAKALAEGGKLDDLDDMDEMEVEPDEINDVVSETTTPAPEPQKTDEVPFTDDDIPDFLK